MVRNAGVVDLNTKKGIAVGVLCYTVWGLSPAYWNLLISVNSLFILCARIVFALIFMVCLLAVTGRMQVFRDTLRDKLKMRYLVPASCLITVNWGMYIWAVNSGRIFDATLGYYMNPLVAFLLGVIVFREKFSKLQLVAVALAFVGVLMSVIAFGRFPILSLSFTFTFASYGVLKKIARADPIASIAVESLLFTPLALVFAFGFMTDSVMSVNVTEVLLLIGAGIVTATPLALYSRAVNDIPYITVGFLHYISPSLALTYGFLTGARLTESQIVFFIFIGLALILFSIELIRNAKKEQIASAIRK